MQQCTAPAVCMLCEKDNNTITVSVEEYNSCSVSMNSCSVSARLPYTLHTILSRYSLEEVAVCPTVTGCMRFTYAAETSRASIHLIEKISNHPK